ncbi:MAG: response regulator [Nitrospina sp.]|jgi:two-component system, OmpR family, alkaline phosphatase synthesis response regulator PhoP|nr:response regulator [Nitrospina sp.]MBT3508625.1 response regulator [Nitrospina sp.]MBT3875649.1 response regulator [Nitrospina sp.]MBT4048514.1 response regulator [Nitrospina sp.]MBT4558924.1 response regulator [Nitrospina sp.]
MKRKEIVVIEDEADILEVIQYNLSLEGYEVCSALDGEEGLRLIKRKVPDLVLLDLMLPGLDGIEICRKLKADPATHFISIIMVTAKGEESDIVLGLGMGADDYVTKPFSPKELMARVKSVLRRGSFRDDNAHEQISRDGMVIDLDRHEVRLEGKKIVLTAKEFQLLYFLASHPGRVFTREDLLNHVSSEDAFIIDRNIDVHIRAIRKKLDKHRDLIETIHRVGYRFRDEED